MEQKESKRFVSMDEYEKKSGARDLLDDSYRVTLEISSQRRSGPLRERSLCLPDS
jgi:hypothetical protein